MFIPIALALWFVAACGLQASPDLEAAVESASPGAGLNILDDVGLSGDGICVVGPYASAARFEDVTGVAWPEIEETAISDNDDVELVAVIDAHEVAAWAIVDRPSGSDLLGGIDRCVQ